MNKRQLRELRTLAERLPDVPRQKFRMDQWGTGKLERDSDGFECDYAACAIGWSPRLVPGIKLRLVADGDREIVPKYNRKRGFDAVACYFGITLDDAIHLFSRFSYESKNPTANTVSRRILGFVARQEQST